jgi:hypothetical protein
MSYGNRSGVFQTEENEFIESQPPYSCFKPADLEQRKSKRHTDCASKVIFKGKEMFFCLTGRRQ